MQCRQIRSTWYNVRDLTEIQDVCYIMHLRAQAIVSVNKNWLAQQKQAITRQGMEDMRVEQGPVPFNQLPIEVLLENILPNLDLAELCTMRGVSKGWSSRICLYFNRLIKLDLSEFKDTINETGFKSIVQHLSRLKEIILDGCWRTASKFNLLALFRNCPSLLHFSSKRCKFVDDEVLACMAQNCRKLEFIDISCCYQARIWRISFWCLKLVVYWYMACQGENLFLHDHQMPNFVSILLNAL